MTSRPRSSALILSLLLLLTYASPASAASGASVAGSGSVSLGDRLQRRFEFDAAEHEDGSVTGYVTFSDPTALADQDVDGTGEAGLEGRPEGLEVTIAVDSLKIEGRRAALSGTVSSTNHPRYAGLRVMLTVEDRGDGGEPAARDRITWVVYRGGAGGWLASDTDNPDAVAPVVIERGFDAERFPLSSFTLARLDEGDIRISE